MDASTLILTQIGTWLLVMMGWYFTHQSNLKQSKKVHKLNLEASRKSKQLDIRIKALTNLYHHVANTSHRPAGITHILEKAVQEIQLLGTRKQVELTRSAIKELAEKKATDFTELLVDLRSELRKELALEDVNDLQILHLRSEDEDSF